MGSITFKYSRKYQKPHPTKLKSDDSFLFKYQAPTSVSKRHVHHQQLTTTSTDQTMTDSHMLTTPARDTPPRSHTQIILERWIKRERKCLEPARVKLQRMCRDAWLMRYEDEATPAPRPLWLEAKKAHERALEDTERAARETDVQTGTSSQQDPDPVPEHPEAVTIKTFLSLSWAEIQLLIDNEAASLNAADYAAPDGKAIPLPTPFMDLINKLCYPRPCCLSEIKASIDLYVEQSAPRHEHMPL